MNALIYTVDDEEPNCIRCDHCFGEDDYCVSQCGAEQGWNGYERIVCLEEE